MCNFWPTCSQFTKGAIRSRGFLPGLVMGADRLMRCNPFAWSYFGRYYTGISHNRLLDPVEDHAGRQGRYPENAGASLSPLREMPDTLSRGSGANLAPALGFAQHLYSEADYARAAAEFLRAAFTDSSTAVRTYANLMAGEAFLRASASENAGTSTLRARETFEGVKHGHADLAFFGVARSWFAQSEYERSRAALDSIVGQELGLRPRLLRSWSLFRQHRFADASLAAGMPEAGVDSGADVGLLAALALLDGHDLPRRNRGVSTALSVILPGAGQAYSGRAGDGVYSLLTVAGSGLAAYWFATNPEKDRTRVKLSIFSALTALFYAGNVYGANIAARDYNLHQRRTYLAQAERILETADLIPDYSSILGQTGSPDSFDIEPGPNRN